MKPDVICVQETWLKSHLDYTIPGYCSYRSDRTTGQGGGCATFIKEGFSYLKISVQLESECVMVEIYFTCGNIKLLIFYSPC
jgi:exonuclease III